MGLYDSQQRLCMNFRESLNTFLILSTVGLASITCGRSADAFFRGRPSKMTMVYNHAVAGNVPSIVMLLNIPNRFPDASPAQISDWQGCLVALWRTELGPFRVTSAMQELSPTKRQCLQRWMAVRYASAPNHIGETLPRIEEALFPFESQAPPQTTLVRQ